MPRGRVKVTAATTTLGERLWKKIPSHLPAEDCWPFQGGLSISGRRKVGYPQILEGGKGSRNWKAHRLVLMLTTGPKDLPARDDEDFLSWLGRLIVFYQDLEAAHQCDTSSCCNPGHLAWETHLDNLEGQRSRQRARDAAEEQGYGNGNSAAAD